MAMKQDDDWQLLNAYVRGQSQEAFGQLVGKYVEMVFQTALRRTRRHDLAEDVAQAVFIVFARSAKHLRPNGSLGAWLHKTALNASSNALRAEARRRRHERAPWLVPSAPVPSDAQNTNMIAAVEVELGRLPTRDRELLSLHYLEGQTMAQIATGMGLTIDAARKRLSRALERLRTGLSRRGIKVGTAVVASVVGTIAAPAQHASAACLAPQILAGGEAGRAFSIASSVIHRTRLLSLAKVAGIAIACLTTSAISIAIIQHQSPATAATTTAAPSTALALQTPLPTFPTTQPHNVIEIPTNIRDALIRNAEQISPITVQWNERFASPLSAEQLTKSLKVVDAESDMMVHDQVTMSISWQEGKYLGKVTLRPRPSRMIEKEGYERDYGFDGRMIYMRTQSDSGAQRPTTKLDSAHLSADADEGAYVSTDYFTQIALPLPVRVIDLKRRAPVRSEILSMLDQGAKLSAVDEVDLDSHKLLRLQLIADDPDRRQAERTNPDQLEKELRKAGVSSDEFIRSAVDAARACRSLPAQRLYVYYLDPQIAYALRRSEQRYDNGILLYRTDCEAFEKVPGRDLHLPHKCIRYEYTRRAIPGTYFKEPVLTVTLDVTAVSADAIPAERFTIR
jgi:RNA polymerase sigma factor (sigma-70 family)